MRPTRKLKRHKPTKNLVEELSTQEKMVQAQRQLLTAALEEQLLQEELAQSEPLSTQHLQEQLPQNEERQRSAQQSAPKAPVPWKSEWSEEWNEYYFWNEDTREDTVLLSLNS